MLTGTWKSSDDSILEVEENGVYTIKKEGAVTVTIHLNCPDQDYSEQYKVSKNAVAKKPAARTKTIKGYRIKAPSRIKRDKSRKFKVITKAGKVSKNWQWKSSNSKVIKISKKGKARPRKKGTATITAFKMGKLIRKKIRVF